MRQFVCDLHVHTGRAAGRPVKVTASRELTVDAAIEEATCRKGLDVLGLADSLAMPVGAELAAMIERGRLTEAIGGGYWAAAGQDRPPLLILMASEMEILVNRAPVHVLAVLPDLAAVRRLRDFVGHGMHNPDLGCQRVHDLDLVGASTAVRAAGGLFGLAHAFTPHRGFYGSTGATVGEATGVPAHDLLDFVEMGLSADTEMADLVPELARTSLVAFSDAHSAGAIAREATAVVTAAEQAGFSVMAAALRGQDGAAIAATYGLDPRLGKYHRTACAECGWSAARMPQEAGPVVDRCPRCGSTAGLAVGVYDRIAKLGRLAARPSSTAGAGPEVATRATEAARPPYRHHIPLRFLPRIGPRTRARLISAFGSELAVLHDATGEQLAAIAGPEIAGTILAARAGALEVMPGGGGKYGRVQPAK